MITTTLVSVILNFFVDESTKKFIDDERIRPYKPPKNVKIHLFLGCSCDTLWSPMMTFLGIVRCFSSKSF
jgi:hypothetical protein